MQYGHWRCPNGLCLHRWTGKTGWSQRVIVWPQIEGDPTMKQGTLNMATMGATSKEDESLITVLKTGFLVRKVKDAHSGRLVDVPPNAVARVIRAINAQTAQSMAQNFPTCRRRAATRA